MRKLSVVVAASGLLLLFTHSHAATETVVIDPGALSCEQLYILASSMEPGTRRYRSPLFNEKTDILATAIGSVSTIGYYYFGFTTLRDYYQDYHRHRQGQELERVRQSMAQKYCFQRS